MLLDLYALPIYFLSAELLNAEYTNTTSLDFMRHFFSVPGDTPTCFPHHIQERRVFGMIPLTVLLIGHLLFPSQGCQLEISGLLTRG